MTLNPLESMLAATLVLLIGTVLNRRLSFLSRYNIPDPVTGGLLFAGLAAIASVTLGFRVNLDLTFKPTLLLMFFAGIGLCADLRQLVHGGRALLIFLVLLLPYILVQNIVGLATALAFDLHPLFGLVGGSITLVGGHGTGAAYAERFSEINNLHSVMELSMTVATIGLIVGGIIGGPVAQYLIARYKLAAASEASIVGEAEAAAPESINTVGVVGALAGILAAVIIGQWLSAEFEGSTITLPTFLWCMMAGMVIRNLMPLARISSDDRAAELMAGVCLSLFLVLAMMALDLIEAALAAGPFLVMIAMQVVFVVLYAIFVCFRFMGRDYEAAVSSAAFIGFNIGTTATAMANMQTIVAKYGPAPQSYLIVPLAGAFFIDLMNAVVLTLMLALPMMGGG